MEDPSAFTPTEIQRDGDSIVISWDDGTVTRWTPGQLRAACPCATCREKRGEDKAASSPAAGAKFSLPTLSAAEAQPLRIETMRPSGRYGYNIAFSDGHSSGIFTFDRLRSAYRGGG